MRDKITNVFFSVVSWTVWAVMIFIIFFSFSLLFTGMDKPPVFSLNSASIAKASPDDENLVQNGKSGDDWYILQLTMDVSASALSPFTYTADGFELNAPNDVKLSHDNFVVLDEALVYSKAVPDEYTLSLFIEFPEGEESLLSSVEEMGFGIRGLEGRLGLIKKTFQKNLPGFYMSDYPDVNVERPDAV